MPIGVFRMLQVPERPTAPDLRDLREFVRRRRRAGGPLEGPRIPGIAPGQRTAEIRPQQVRNKKQHARGLKGYADSDNEIPDVPAAPRLVGIDSTRHPEHAGNVHEIEGQMESDEEQPEMQLAEALVVHSAGHLREPIVKSGEERKK